MFAMEHFDVAADLTCIGKSIGGGLPLSGIVGKADIVDSVPPAALVAHLAATRLHVRQPLPSWM